MADPVEIRRVQSGGSETPTPGPDLAPEVTETSRIEGRRMNRLQAAAEVVIATAVVLTIIYYAKLPLIVLLVSILLAFILTPVVDLLAKLRVPNWLGSLIATLLLIAVLYGLFTVSYNRGMAFLQDLPQYSGELRKVVGHVRQKAEKIQKTTESTIGDKHRPPSSENTPSINITGWIASNVGPITEIVFIVSFIPFLVYFMLSWQDHVRTQTVMLFKMENRNTAYVTVGLISKMIRSYIVGNLLIGLFMGGISTAIFGIIGLPYFYFVGFISGFLSLVPYLGVVLAIVPPVVTGLGQIHSRGFAIIVLTVLGLHLFALNVLYPKFLGSRLRMNPLAVTVALLFWGWLWGAMGLILAIPVTGAMKIVFDHVESLRPYGDWLGE